MMVNGSNILVDGKYAIRSSNVKYIQIKSIDTLTGLLIGHAYWWNSKNINVPILSYNSQGILQEFDHQPLKLTSMNNWEILCEYTPQDEDLIPIFEPIADFIYHNSTYKSKSPIDVFVGQDTLFKLSKVYIFNKFSSVMINGSSLGDMEFCSCRLNLILDTSLHGTINIVNPDTNIITICAIPLVDPFLLKSNLYCCKHEKVLVSFYEYGPNARYACKHCGKDMAKDE